jgi:hypothetical protein
MLTKTQELNRTNITSGGSLITDKLLDAQKNKTEEMLLPVDRSLGAGYRSLMRDDTLAGREASANFRGEERFNTGSRLMMVRRLRQKEKWLIWKDFFRDADRQVGIAFGKMAPGNWLPSFLDGLGVKVKL